MAVYTAAWKSGLGLFRADAQKVADELYSIGDEFTPEQIVEKARDESTELHKCFEWNDEIAAHHYRLQQARVVVCNLVIKEQQNDDAYQKRVFYKTDTAGGYKPLSIVMKNKDEYEKLLERANAELRSFRTKYDTLRADFEELFALLDAIA